MGDDDENVDGGSGGVMKMKQKKGKCGSE